MSDSTATSSYSMSESIENNFPKPPTCLPSALRMAALLSPPKMAPKNSMEAAGCMQRFPMQAVSLSWVHHRWSWSSRVDAPTFERYQHVLEHELCLGRHSPNQNNVYGEEQRMQFAKFPERSLRHVSSHWPTFAGHRRSPPMSDKCCNNLTGATTRGNRVHAHRRLGHKMKGKNIGRLETRT